MAKVLVKGGCGRHASVWHQAMGERMTDGATAIAITTHPTVHLRIASVKPLVQHLAQHLAQYLAQHLAQQLALGGSHASVWHQATGGRMTHGATPIAITSHHTVQLRIAIVSPLCLRSGRHASVWHQATGDRMTHGATPIAITTHHTVQLRIATVPPLRPRWFAQHQQSRWVVRAWQIVHGRHASVWQWGSGDSMTIGATTIAITTHHTVQLRIASVPPL